jgi:hypothetical protein
METVINWLLGRKRVEHKECQGLSLAIQTVEGFVGRTFTCPETTPKTSGIHGEEILNLIQEKLPSYYDKKRIPQAEIEIVGSIGISRRYNPLDRTFHIATETPKLHGS